MEPIPTKALTKRRTRILFVIGSFAQAGAERYLFELCRGLDRDRFDVEVLTTVSQNPNEFYFLKIRELGIVIHRRLPTPRALLLDLIPDKRRTRALRRGIERWVEAENAAEAAVRLRGFFDDYDIVSVVMVENYYKIAPLVARHPRVVIHLMSAQVQYEYDLYARLPAHRNYRFVTMDSNQRADLRGSPGEGCDTFEVPLPLDMAGRENLYAGPSGDLRVCLVSRIDPQRLLDIYLWSFQALVEELDVRMVVYGGGDRALLERPMKRLHIRDRVSFAGHQSDLRAMIVRDQPMLVWMISLDDTVGYASIELASYGVPILFSNAGVMDTAEVARRTQDSIYTYRTVPSLARATREALSSPGELAARGERLRRHLVAKHDAKTVIPRLEGYYLDLVGSRIGRG